MQLSPQSNPIPLVFVV